MAVKWYVGRLKHDVGRYKAGEDVPFKHTREGKPSKEDYAQVFTYVGTVAHKTKKSAWESARG